MKRLRAEHKFLFYFLSFEFLVDTFVVGMFSDVHTTDKLRVMCAEHAKLADQSVSSKLEAMFFGPSPSQVLYHLEVRQKKNKLLKLKVYFDFNSKAYQFISKCK